MTRATRSDPEGSGGMARNTLRKVFGVGPIGVAISVMLLLAALAIDRALGHPRITDHSSLIKIIGAILVSIGLILYLWAVYTLRGWWLENRLCTSGPFRWFRHPVYAAWITFILAGVALYLNSWVLLIWVVSLHPVWHWLVIGEEKMMVEHFGDEYRRYAERTGRFIPRLFSVRRAGKRSHQRTASQK
jgi:protein-S-isoprenylcysteine O-methyltransferase Ste14